MDLNKNIILFKNCGFCYGVNHSIRIVLNTIKNKKYPRPIYLLNSIVHNQFVNDYFLKLGVKILEGKSKLELLDQVKEGTVIFSAHGVGDIVKEKAKDLNIVVVDATCPFVERSYQLIKEYLNNGYHLLYIGKDKHPETEAVLSFSSNITLISSLDFTIPSCSKLAIAHQTTMSDYDVKKIYRIIKEKAPYVVVLPMLCNATQLRQTELLNYLENNDLANTLIIIVGDKNSNNCTKLFELGKRYTSNCIFINDYRELINQDLSLFNNFVITSGTSTPIINVNNVFNFLNKHKLISTKNLKKYIS